ncbi:MAG: PKD domain-containing protein [Bacteroidota bacterium]
MKKAILTISILLILLPLAVGQDYYRVRKHTRISTGMDEAAAVPYEDGVVYITESTSVGASSPTDAEGRRLFTIFQYKEGGQKKPFIDALVSQRHEGPVSFSGDFKTMVFAQQRPSGVNRDYDPLGLYFAERVDDKWTNIRAYAHNDDFAWLFSPALSKDGKTLYFAANYEDGLGGFDIYRSQLKGGSWSEPENLGPAVNSEGHELYPYIHPSGRLYFSSDGHDGNVAGFDLFQTAIVQGEWSAAIKLGAPFNSLSDEYHIYFKEDFKSGFLTSNKGSGSKEIFAFNTDIPEFESPQPIKKTYYKYKIYDRKLDTVDTELFRYSWVINDTLEVPGHEIIYKFPEPGTYKLKLNVFDIQLDTLLEPQTFKTLTIKLNEQAVIRCPDTVTVNTPVQFDGSETYLPGFNVGRYLWEFGDGTFGQGIQTTHTYYYPGKYRVILGVEERTQNRRDEPDIKVNFKDIVVVQPEKSLTGL